MMRNVCLFLLLSKRQCIDIALDVCWSSISLFCVLCIVMRRYRGLQEEAVEREAEELVRKELEEEENKQDTGQ